MIVIESIQINPSHGFGAQHWPIRNWPLPAWNCRMVWDPLEFGRAANPGPPETWFSREVALSVEIEIAESGHLRPLAATRWKRPLAATCGHLRPLAATCGHLRPLAWSGHLRPLAATRWERPLAATCGHLRPLAATRLEWPVAATCGHSLERPLAATRLERPLAATCGHSLGAATCSHLRPLEWLRVAASGCEWLRVAASGCVLVEIDGRVGILKKIGSAGKAFYFQVWRLDR